MLRKKRLAGWLSSAGVIKWVEFVAPLGGVLCFALLPFYIAPISGIVVPVLVFHHQGWGNKMRKVTFLLLLLLDCTAGLNFKKVSCSCKKKLREVKCFYDCRTIWHQTIKHHTIWHQELKADNLAPRVKNGQFGNRSNWHQDNLAPRV